MDGETRDLSRSDVLDGAAAEATVALVVVHTPDEKLRGSLIAVERPLAIGRREIAGVDVGIDDPRVSRRHATVRPRADKSGVEIEEHGSRNGLFVDGRKSDGGMVAAGSVVRLGDTIFAVSHVPWRTPKRRPAGVVGSSARLLDALSTCENLAESDLSVLLLGETGTGKEVFAHALHELSGRRGALVTINSAAIPQELMESYLFGHQKGAFTGATADRTGYFAQAERGTLFFDEIGALLPSLQAKLLRVLESREFSPVGSTAVVKSDVRVVAATNADLQREVEVGTFRRDLYARLAGAIIRLPSLRQRREDIPVLARHFLDALPLPWTANFTELLVAHPWPMNVRELRTTMQRLLLSASGESELRGSRLKAVLDAPPPEDTQPADDGSSAPPRKELSELLERHKGNVSELAKHYQKDRKQIYRWLRRHNLRGDDFR